MQFHQLDHVQTICTSVKTDNHTNTSSLIFTGWMHFLMPNQQRQSTEGTKGCKSPLKGNSNSRIKICMARMLHGSTIYSPSCLLSADGRLNKAMSRFLVCNILLV